MNIRPPSQWTTYRYRYVIAYTVLAAVAASLLTMYLQRIPPGLGSAEAQSVVTSASVSFTHMPRDIIDLPYHLLQKLSVEFLGVTPFGVRLPSIIFGILTALCMTLMLRRWFKPNIALLAAIIIVTSGWLLSMSRLGAPVIMIPFWTSLLLLCATHVSQQSSGWRTWKIIMALAAALSLYTPFMIYLFIAVAIAAFIQPHVRFLVRESGALTITLGFMGFAALLLPLGWGIYHNPGLLRDLAAIPKQLPEPLIFFGGLIDAASNLVNPFNLTFAETLTPALSVVSVALLIMGGIRLLGDFHSVRAYVLLIWAAILIPVIGLNPSRFAVLFVPAMLVIAIGLHLVVVYWYRLFPRNPYARIFGLLPLTMLILSIVQFNYQRYFYGMSYNEQAGSIFKQDAFLAQKYLQTLPRQTNLTVVVSDEDKALYSTMIRNRPQAKVVTATEATTSAGTWVVAHNQRAQLGNVSFSTQPKSLIVTDRKDDALRFWVYQQ